MILIADSGSTKCEWRLAGDDMVMQTVETKGISPYFLTKENIYLLLQNELLTELNADAVTAIYYYGTGLSVADNITMVDWALHQAFPMARIYIETDLEAAARALCGKQKGIACILGTGSNSCYYNGDKVVKNSPGLGYVLGDEGSGSYLGRKVIQYYLYNTFDEEMKSEFDAKYKTNATDILDQVYRKPFPNRYLATFTHFLSENRGHYMIENILEDGINDFFFTHLHKYAESWTLPVNFTGSVAFAFKDIIKELCSSYQLDVGNILKSPMDGLVKYHIG